MTLKIKVAGEITAQARPKFSVVNGIVRTYDPAKSKNYKNLVKELAMVAMQEGHWRYTELPISFQINVWMPFVKADSKKFRLAALNGEFYPTKKPDADNIAKIFMDALTGVAYKDDNQVCELIVKKLYTDEGPSVDVVLEVMP